MSNVRTSTSGLHTVSHATSGDHSVVPMTGSCAPGHDTFPQHSVLCLPDEVLGQSFLRLDWTDLLRVQGVCRRFKAAAGPESLAWASCCTRRWAGPLNTALFEEKAVQPSAGGCKAPAVNWKRLFLSDNGWAAPQFTQQDISSSGQAAIGVSAMAVSASRPEESMLAYSTAEELYSVKLGRSGRPEGPRWQGRIAASGAGAEEASLPTALAVLGDSCGRLAVGTCEGDLSVCELAPQDPEASQNGPVQRSASWQAGRVPVTELHYLAAAGRLASLHSGMLAGAHVLQDAGRLVVWDLGTQHRLLQAQDVLDGFRLVASVPVDEGGNELLAASYKLSDSQMLRGQCHMCPLETPTSLCFHKARISSAALCIFDARAPAGMVQRFSTGHRSIYPRLQLVRQHFMVTSHAGTPVALWDRRHMNGPVHEVQHLPTHLDPPPPTPLPPCEDLPFNQGLHLHATQDLLVGRADNGMIWLWDLSERLGWADGSHPGTWLREVTAATAAAAGDGMAAAHNDAAPGGASLGAGQGDGGEQQALSNLRRQGVHSLHEDERDYDRSPLPLGCLWPPEPVPCRGPQGDAQWVPLPELWVGHCWLAGLGCGDVYTEEDDPKGLPVVLAPQNTVFSAALTVS